MDSMSLNDLAVGETAPDFELKALNGRTHRLSNASGSVVVLNFWSVECPWAERGDELLLSLLEDWGSEVLVWWIDSNVNETPDRMRAEAEARGVGPVLIDPDHAVADQYGAATTPHVYVIDGDGILRYRGAPDDVNWAQKEPKTDYLGPAVAAAREGRSPDPASTPAFGCSLVRFDTQSG
jgi:peroxiredoxin